MPFILLLSILLLLRPASTLQYTCSFAISELFLSPFGESTSEGGLPFIYTSVCPFSRVDLSFHKRPTCNCYVLFLLFNKGSFFKLNIVWALGDGGLAFSMFFGWGFASWSLEDQLLYKTSNHGFFNDTSNFLITIHQCFIFHNTSSLHGFSNCLSSFWPSTWH